MQVHHIRLQLSQLLLTDFLHRIPRSFFVLTFSVKQHQQTISVAHQFPEKQFSLTNCSCHNQQLRTTAMMANLTEYESSTYTTQVFLLEDHLLALSKQKGYVFSLSLIKTNRQKVQNVANSSVFFSFERHFLVCKVDIYRVSSVLKYLLPRSTIGAETACKTALGDEIFWPCLRDHV